MSVSEIPTKSIEKSKIVPGNKTLLQLILKKLRDVLQEREDTSLNYFKVFLNYIEHFSQSI